MRPATVAVVDLGLGNIGSVVNMLKKTGARAEAVSEPDQLAHHERFVLPGVGAFDRGMERLDAGGWRAALEREVIGAGKPILGICLGLQLFCKTSEEGTRTGLGWLDADVVRLKPQRPDGSAFPVPHMGWSEIEPGSKGPFFAGGAEHQRFYFLHSYHPRCRDASLVLAACRYGDIFPCALGRGNVLGVQFHPEKSHAFGLHLMKNFVEGRS